MKKFILVLFLISMSFTVGCSHSLQVRNLDSFIVPFSFGESEKKVNLGIMPFTGKPDGLWFFNAIVESLNSRKDIDKLQTNYGAKGKFNPDYILSIEPQAKYKSSAWNFIINFPGFIIFTPAWNGYVYSVDIKTTVTVYDGEEKKIKSFEIKTPYSIRHAEFDRTSFAELGYFLFGVPSFLGGIYNAFAFDDDIKGDLQFKIKENYRSYVVEQIMKETRW